MRSTRAASRSSIRAICSASIPTASSKRTTTTIEIRNPWDEQSFAATMHALLDRTEFDDGIVYIEVSRGEGERAHFYPDDMTPTAIAYSRRFKFPDAAKKERGVRLISTEDLRWK